MTAFKEDHRGWWRATIRREIVEAARIEVKRLDVEREGKHVVPGFVTPKTWAGIVVEPRIAVWLGERGLVRGADFIENGGHDALPDYEIFEQPVAVKSPVRKRFELRYNAEVPEERRIVKREYGHDFLWVAIEDAGGPTVEMIVMGAMRAGDFWETATVVKQGDTFAGGSTVTADAAQVRFDQLTPPGKWLLDLQERKIEREKDGLINEWADQWKALYELRLPRPEHEQERDLLLGRAREVDALDICMKGHSRSIPFRGPYPWKNEG